MSAESDDFVHLTAERSWLTGRITGLCGITREAGEYETLWLAPFRPRCPECKRIAAKR